MGFFTRLGPADVAEISRAFELGRVEVCQNIPFGTVNSNYRVAAEAGGFFLRVNEGKSEDEVAYEAELVSWLCDHEVPAPRPRWARVKAGLVTIFPWLGGMHRQRSQLTADDCRAFGATLARLHAAGGGFPRRAESRYRFEKIVERWEALGADCCDPALLGAVTDVGEEIAWLEQHADARAALPAGVVHNDLFPDNVLWDGPRLQALLDFEQASDGTFAWDLAVCLNAWCWDDAPVPARVAGLVAGYQSVRPLAPEERRLLLTETRAAAMRFTVTRITDVYLNPEATNAVRAAKDFRRYHTRLRTWREMGEETFGRLVG